MCVASSVSASPVGAKCGRPSLDAVVDGNNDLHPIVCDGQLAALAGREHCYFLTEDLTDEQFRLVAAMCLCSREVRAGHLEGPFTIELAARWARVFLGLVGRVPAGGPRTWCGRKP